MARRGSLKFGAVARAFALAVAMLAGSEAGVSGRPSATLAYTLAGHQHCRRIEENRRVGYWLAQCPGIHRTALYLLHQGDDAESISAGEPDGQTCVAGAGCELIVPDQKVEWLIAHGKPFAIIYVVRNPDPLPARSREF